MKKKIVIIFIAGIMLLITSISAFISYQNKKSQQILNLSTEQKLADFDVLREVLDTSYPFWKEVYEAGIDKEAMYTTYRNNIEKSNTDIEFFKEVSYLLKEFKGYGHISVLDGYMYRLYTETIITGKGLLTEDELAEVQPLISVLTNSVSQNTYSLLDQSHSGFRSIVGLKNEYKNTNTSDLVEESSAIVSQVLDDKKIAYIQIPSFELINYQRDKMILNQFFEENKETPNLIIDLRGNSGGSDLYWKELIVEPLISKETLSERYFFFNLNEKTKQYVEANLADTEIMVSTKLKNNTQLSQYKDRFSHYTINKTTFNVAVSPYQGKIWVLVDGDVYSASENFAMFCKNTGFATLLGTATGGDGGMADPLLISLPNSGLLVRFSMFYGLNTDGSGNEANGTLPDVIVEEDKDALDECLGLIY